MKHDLYFLAWLINCREISEKQRERDKERVNFFIFFLLATPRGMNLMVELYTGETLRGFVICDDAGE